MIYRKEKSNISLKEINKKNIFKENKLELNSGDNKYLKKNTI